MEQGNSGLRSGPHEDSKSMEGVWQIHPGNDDVASSCHPSDKAAEMSLPGMAPASPPASTTILQPHISLANFRREIKHYFRQSNIGVHADHSAYISQSAVVSVCYERDVLRYVHNLSESNDVLDLLSSGSLLSWSSTRPARK